jgi:hypothetical protein
VDGMELEYRRLEGPHGCDGAGIQEGRGNSWMGWSWNTGG